MGSTDTPVSVAVTHVVYPGKEHEFTSWAKKLDTEVAKADGYLGSVRLHDSQGVSHLVYQFDSWDHLRAWEFSTRRRELLDRSRESSDQQRTTVEGPEPWFIVPGQRGWPKWKNFLLTWMFVFPTLVTISYALAAIDPRLPKPLSLAISSIALTSLLTWGSCRS